MEILHNNYSLWKTTFPTVDLSPHVTKANASFTTDITLGVNGIVFSNAHTLDRVILEALYNNHASWKTTFPTVTVDLTSYATKANIWFNTDITLGVNGIVFTNTSGVPHTLDRAILESLYTTYSSWKTTFATVDLIELEISAKLSIALNDIYNGSD